MICERTVFPLAHFRRMLWICKNAYKRYTLYHQIQLSHFISLIVNTPPRYSGAADVRDYFLVSNSYVHKAVIRCARERHTPTRTHFNHFKITYQHRKFIQPMITISYIEYQTYMISRNNAPYARNRNMDMKQMVCVCVCVRVCMRIECDHPSAISLPISVHTHISFLTYKHP